MELIGRSAEQELLGARLADRRLVTLVGPAGVGKTTLADTVAAENEDRFELGRRRVDLTLLDNPEQLDNAIAGQLGYPGFTELVESPVDETVLLVIDNCEHVVDAAAHTIAALLDACDAPTILCTSRRPLDIRGETVLQLGPLALPPPGVVEVEAAAVTLFLDRAADAGVDPSTLDPEAVCELTRRLDGNPLALEIAAARVRSIGPRDVLSLLADRLDVLERPRYRGARRHRGLRTAIDWSYELLDDDSRDLLDRLGTMSGGFDAAMAVAVADRDEGDRVEVLDQLDELVASSLVVADVSTSPTTYRLLESVRTYARERLGERDLEAVTMNRLVDHLLGEATGIIISSSGNWSDEVVPRLLGLYPHMRAAIGWCLTCDDESDRAELFTALLWGIVHQARTAEIHELAHAVLERWPDSTGGFRPDTVATAATAAYLLGDVAEARALATGAVDAADASGRSPASVSLRRVLAQVAGATGHPAEALRGFADGARYARELNLPAMAMELEADMAELMYHEGRLDEALELLRAVVAESRESGSVLTDIWGRTIEASILLEVDPDAALALAEDLVAESRRVGYPAGIIINLRVATIVLAHQGRPVEAAERGLEGLRELTVHGMLHELRLVLDGLIAVLAVTGRHQRLADLVATLETLPVVTVVARERQKLVPVPEAVGVALSRRDAIDVVRAELRAVVAAEKGTGKGEAVPEESGVVPVDHYRFRHRGEFFEVGSPGRSGHLKVSKGLVDIRRLLDQPGVEIHCLDLAGGGVDQGGTGPAIDEQARRGYEDRIRDLQAELDEADRANDIARSEQLGAELDTLIEHLSAGLGLAGRDRATGTSAERARSSVTQRIRSAIRRITDLDQPLGQHLQASVHTGLWCRYDPVDGLVWDLEPQPMAP